MTPTIVIIPGSFRPPHRGHWDMISHYAGLADYVVVLVSDPKRACRPSSDESVSLTPQKAKAVLDIFIRRSGLKNVRVRVSPEPSPVKAMLSAMSELRDCNVVVGHSDKDGVAKYGWVRQTPALASTGVTVSDPSKTAFPAKSAVSASGIRSDIRDFSAYYRALPDFLEDEDVIRIRDVIYG